MRKILPVLLLSLVLTGCAGTKVGDFISAVTTTVVNPVSATNIYQVKNAEAAVLELSVAWRRNCWSKPYVELMKEAVNKALCQNRRPTLRKIQDAKAYASLAIMEAEAFVRNNPTINATTAIQAAWNAISAYRNAIPAVK